jgi:hypothetical protein
VTPPLLCGKGARHRVASQSGWERSRCNAESYFKRQPASSPPENRDGGGLQRGVQMRRGLLCGQHLESWKYDHNSTRNPMSLTTPDQTLGFISCHLAIYMLRFPASTVTERIHIFPLARSKIAQSGPFCWKRADSQYHDRYVRPTPYSVVS